MAHLRGRLSAYITALKPPRLRIVTRSRTATVCSLVTLLLAAGCSSETSNEEPPKERGQTEFVSSLSPQDEASAADSDDTTAEPQSGAPSTNADGAAERAITEADIIHIDGDTLFALSEYSGLTLVDLSDPTDLKAIGNATASGAPFEMYVRDDVVISMLNAYGHYVRDEQTQRSTWVETSRVLALDVSQPGNIEQLGELSVPGQISDSRLVGDILYLVTTEYGCWGCSEGPSTVVTSFNLEDLQNVRKVDQLRFEEPADTYIGQRSITVTPERIYIGGRDWNWQDGNEGGTIQVVDISDPAGDISEGQVLAIAGQIDSRWQMDEHEGILRVLSQWEEWRADSPPSLETYRVNSATDITKLASLEVQLPRPEVLQSVRFDGDRAYAITFEQTDPLFTFDLSDPEAPKQMGELEIPGWVYHMEPRGNRIYAIGFDQENQSGALHVSLFDVEDLANPVMLDRVNFGGDWGSFAEDQDRIHKSFKLLDQEGFMVVPFSAYDWDANSCNSTYGSGIQLVDFTTDTLTLRGVAPQVGEARRAFTHGGHLFGVSDDAVQSFDIEDRDEIKKVDTLETARNVETVRIVGDKVLRFGTDWWTERTSLDIAELSEVSVAETQRSLDLNEVLDANPDECSSGASWGNVYVVGAYAYVERYTYSYVADVSSEHLTLLVVELEGEAPTIVNQVQIDLQSQNDTYRYFSGVVQTDSALLVGVTQYDYRSDQPSTETSYQVIDTRDSAHPAKMATLEVPEALVRQGWGRFEGGCSLDMGWGWGGYYGYGYGSQDSTALVSGDLVISSHAEPLPNEPARGRYYLDRFDVSDPANPVLLQKINVPGRVVYFDADTGRLLTIEDQSEPLELMQEDCWERNGSEPTVNWRYGTSDGDEGHCERTRQVMHRLTVASDVAELKESAALDGGDWYLDSSAVTQDRVFLRQFQTQKLVEDYNGESYEYWSKGAQRVRVLDASLERVADLADPGTGWEQLRARGTRAFSNEQGVLRVFDASDLDAPKVYEKQLLGYGCNSLEVRGNSAICAQGKKGVELIALD